MYTQCKKSIESVMNYEMPFTTPGSGEPVGVGFFRVRGKG